MNAREQFLQYAQSIITRTTERIKNLDEAQVIHWLRSLEAHRKSENETRAYLNSTSLKPSDDSSDAINQLRSELSSPARSDARISQVSDYIEDTLKKRLEEIRRKK